MAFGEIDLAARLSPSDSLREFLLRPRSEAQLRLDAVPLPPMPEGFEDWTYWDMPGRVTKQEWVAFLKMLGSKNHLVLCHTTMPGRDEWRGQFLISPEGMKRMNAFIALS